MLPNGSEEALPVYNQRPEHYMPTKKAEEEDKPAAWSMGLRGLAGLIANCTAIGLICLMFYQDRHSTLLQYKEDRTMFREELKEQRNATTASMNKMSKALEELANELRQISRMKQSRKE